MYHSSSGRSRTLSGCFGILAGILALPTISVAAENISESNGATMRLFQAVQANDLAAAQVSVADGANVETHDRWGMTPADIAIDRGYYRIAHFLVSVRNAHRGDESHFARSTKPAGIANNASSPPAAPAKAPIHRLVGAPAPKGNSPQFSAFSPAVSAGKANPFDPAVPAPGAQLRSMLDGG